MAFRHRVPTVFSIYMLDVICCALGCVILLWQVSYQQAEQQTAEAKEERAKYLAANDQVVSTSAEVRDLQRVLASERDRVRLLNLDLVKVQNDLDASQQLATSRLSEFEKVAAQLKKSEDALAEQRAMAQRLSTDLSKTQVDLSRVGSDLGAEAKRSADLQAKIARAETAIRSLEKDKESQEAALTLSTKNLQEQLAKLLSSEAAREKLEKQLATTRAEGDVAQTKLALSEKQLQALSDSLDRNKKDTLDSDQRYRESLDSIERLNKQLLAATKDLNIARGTITTLESDKTKLQSDQAKLASKALSLEVAAEQRFAGIELKGENVIFLVDMSGSMEMTDNNTLNPDKWPLVCETIARILRSLQGLRRFQVILFSDRPRYLFGHDGQWLKYDGDATAKTTLTTLKSVKPAGETNLHTAFAEAFRFRSIGLDTIYLISDGLPTSGEGLPANADKLTESQRTDLMSRDLRAKLKNEWNRTFPKMSKVRINTIGYFFESPDVGAFLWALAREHDGSFVGMSKP